MSDRLCIKCGHTNGRHINTIYKHIDRYGQTDGRTEDELSRVDIARAENTSLHLTHTHIHTYNTAQCPECFYTAHLT